MENAVNTEFQHRGRDKSSSNASLRNLVKRIFESFKVLSSSINEVYCGILKSLKRYRNKYGMTQLCNTSHKTIINCFARQSGMTHFVKCVAFTLAETLVVMGIIGVVAALTIPNLNQSTGDREKVAKVKKIYSNLEDAFGRATAVYGPIDEWFINDVDNDGKPDKKAASTRLAERMTEFMKISKNCGYTEAGCFADNYKHINGDDIGSPTGWSTEPMVLLADGTALDFDWLNHLIFVDIDGIKGANTYGKDFFMFTIVDSILPAGREYSSENLKKYCFSTGVGCTAWIIETGNMDYLKAKEGVCPDGTTLSWENTSCK